MILASLRRPALVLGLLFGIGAGSALADPCSSSRERRGPPPESLAACEALAEESACSFVGRRSETVTGLCLRPPHGEELALACVPENHRRRGGDREEPSSEAS